MAQRAACASRGSIAMAQTDHDRQFLNIVDQTTLLGRKTLCALGYPGYLCQLQIWFKGRADAAALSRAISRLSRCYPVVTARLVDEDGRANPYWRFRSGAESRLEEVTLHSNDEAALMRFAEALLATPVDLAGADPVGFHLIHRPGGGDILIMQYDH